MIFRFQNAACHFVFCAGLVLAMSACALDSADQTMQGTMPAPPGSEKNRPLEKVAVPTPMDSLRALSPPEGLKFTPLFTDEIDNESARFKRLEDAVQEVRNDMDTVVPALVRIAEIERDNRAVAVQEQELATGMVMAPPVTAGSEMQKMAETPVAVLPSSPPPASVVPADKKTDAPAAQPPAATPPLGDVKGVRIADHKDKTRLVLDMTAKYPGAARLENNGKQLVIPLHQLNWLGQKSHDFDSAELVSGYHTADGNLYVDLMYASQIRMQDVLPPGANSKNYRVVIDLFSPDVHK